MRFTSITFNDVNVHVQQSALQPTTVQIESIVYQNVDREQKTLLTCNQMENK